MVVFPKAKINIGLRIVEKRPDGFHNIETFFYPVDLADALEFVAHTAAGWRSHCGQPVAAARSLAICSGRALRLRDFACAALSRWIELHSDASAA